MLRCVVGERRGVERRQGVLFDLERRAVRLCESGDAVFECLLNYANGEG